MIHSLWNYYKNISAGELLVILVLILFLFIYKFIMMLFRFYEYVRVKKWGR